MVLEQGPTIIGRDMSLALHTVIEGRVQNDVIYAALCMQMCVLCERWCV